MATVESTQPVARGARGSHRLVAINVGLALCVGVAAVVSPLEAQQGQPAKRSRGDYSAVSAAMQGGNSDAIFVLDAANQEMVIVRWNDSKRTLEGIGYRSLADDASAAAPAPGVR